MEFLTNNPLASVSIVFIVIIVIGLVRSMRKAPDTTPDSQVPRAPRRTTDEFGDD